MTTTDSSFKEHGLKWNFFIIIAVTLDNQAFATVQSERLENQSPKHNFCDESGPKLVCLKNAEEIHWWLN